MSGKNGGERGRARRRRGVSGGGGEPRRFGRLTYTVLVLAVLGATAYFLKPLIFPDRADRGDVIEIRADMGGFSQREVRVRAGQTVTVRLTSMDTQFHRDGGGKHEFAIDELGVDIIAPPRGSASQTFTPTEPGVYDFYCSVCCGGRANPAMHGRFIVEA